MKRPIQLALILAAFTLSTGCEMLNSTHGYAATDQYCGNRTEDCPIW